MSTNKKCPKCGSTKVQLSSENSKHGFLWLILFGIYYAMWWMCKLIVAMCVFLFFDWWYALINSNQSKGYVWLSKRILQNKTKLYYCHECGHNFKG